MPDQRPSVTAAVVASTLLLLRGDDELAHLVPTDTLEAIQANVRSTLPPFGYLLDHVPWPLLRRAAYLAEGLLSPGFVVHYALRKHAVRAELLRAVDDGVRQVVLVGAGFDMLAFAIPALAQVFEVDHPATQRARVEAIRGAPAGRAVTFVPVDLSRHGLLDALTATGSFDTNAETVYVAEGLLMYLPPARVANLLDDLAASKGACRLIATVVTPDPRGRLRLHSQRRVVDWCMRWLDEPFVWGERRERLRQLLERHGLTVETIVSTTELRNRLLEPKSWARMPRPTGEVVIVARGPRRS